MGMREILNEGWTISKNSKHVWLGRNGTFSDKRIYNRENKGN